ncbi:hypothetical protein [Photobacterium sanguinicancri]|uniref:hypothetical protein n=1 Tax=Photobacterium sanguinicancri TaxID=875932 RepID=UPI0024809C76|nr:hypothetical protein [Photobacterium sanguinicancri]
MNKLKLYIHTLPIPLSRLLVAIILILFMIFYFFYLSENDDGNVYCVEVSGVLNRQTLVGNERYIIVTLDNKNKVRVATDGLYIYNVGDKVLVLERGLVNMSYSLVIDDDIECL